MVKYKIYCKRWEKIMDNLKKYLKPFYLKISGVLFIKITGTIVDLLIPLIIADMINNIESFTGTNQDYQKLWIRLGLMIGLAFYGVITNIFSNGYSSNIASRIVYQIRKDTFDKIIKLETKDVDNFTISSLISRMTTDIYNIQRMCLIFLRAGVRAPILLLGGVLLAFKMHPLFAVILLSIIPFVFIVFIIISKKSNPMFAAVQKQTDSFTRVFRENVKGIRVIKALSMKEYEEERFNIESEELSNREFKTNILLAKMNPLMNIFINIGLVSCIIMGAFLVHNNKTEVGNILALVTYCSMIQMALMTLSRLYQVYSKAIASMKRVFEVTLLEEKPNQEYLEFKFNKTIEFRNLYFSYYKKNNIENINFTIKKNQSVAFIGMTGSGKTTLLSTLNKIYRIPDNSILIDGVDLNFITSRSMREHIGYSLQNGMIFNDTILKNICLEREYSETELVKACKTSDAYDFIMEKELGFETILNQGGTNLSGGQKQRILIARALLNAKDILILDDSLSALDYLTELKVRQKIKEEYPNLTFINISQRISSIVNFDLIVLFNRGKIEDFGKHEDLLASSKLYQEIYYSQVEVKS